MRTCTPAPNASASATHTTLQAAASFSVDLVCLLVEDEQVDGKHRDDEGVEGNPDPQLIHAHPLPDTIVLQYTGDGVFQWPHETAGGQPPVS